MLLGGIVEITLTQTAKPDAKQKFVKELFLFHFTRKKMNCIEK